MAVLLTFFRVPVIQDFRNGGIGHPPIGADHALHDPMIRHPPLRINRHQAGKRQPVLLLIKRTNPVAELSW